MKESHQFVGFGLHSVGVFQQLPKDGWALFSMTHYSLALTFTVLWQLFLYGMGQCSVTHRNQSACQIKQQKIAAELKFPTSSQAKILLMNMINNDIQEIPRAHL